MSLRSIIILFLSLLVNAGRMSAVTADTAFVSPTGLDGYYQLQYHSLTLSDMSGLTARSSTPTVSQRTLVDVQALIRIVASTERSLLVQCVSMQAFYSVNDVSQRYLSQRITEELQSSIELRYDANGMLCALIFNSTTSTESRSLAASLFHSLQFVRYSKDSTTVIESDRAGLCRVMYSPTAKRPNNTHLFKQLLGYTPQKPRGVLNMNAPRQSARIRGTQSADWLDARLQSCSGCDTQTVRIGNSDIANTQTSYSWRRVNMKNVLDTMSIHLDNSTSIELRLPEVYDEAEIRRGANQALLGSSTLTGLLDSLELYPKADSSLRRQLPNKLRAVVALVDGAADSLMKRAANYADNDERLHMVATLLARDESPRAQEHFLTIALRPFSRLSLRASFISLFGVIGKAQARTLNALQNVARTDSNSTIRATALMALASIASTVAEHDSLLAEHIVDFIMQERANLSTDIFLLVIGNAGLHSCLATLDSLYHNSDSTLQIKTLFAMRFIVDTTVDNILAHHLIQADTNTFLQLMRIASFRAPNLKLLVAFDTLLHTQQIPEHRELILRQLQRWVQYDDSFRIILKQKLRADSLQEQEKAEIFE